MDRAMRLNRRLSKGFTLPDRLSPIQFIITSTIFIAGLRAAPLRAGAACLLAYLLAYLLTLTDDELVLPALSFATAVSVWVPEAIMRVFQR